MLSTGNWPNTLFISFIRMSGESFMDKKKLGIRTKDFIESYGGKDPEEIK